ncbi:response regulator [Candidatus Rhodoluna planktonica]|uniref:Response regulatory domain-containing protein n=1 Tax=Candidatus Rhodoluna planktonica TaxID=535712 RepID=A0A1D9DXF8_9MICO|nr:response regulator [Candidatus Rhodoluna planktonica]AOY55480.1 hypothetical protein A4Z71_00190 [Candidatus Rhodoluna planktonica]
MTNPLPLRKVLIVEDEGFTRSLTAEVLSRAGFDVAEASNAVLAKRAVLDFDPDAMVVDIELGDGPSGLDLISALSKTHSHIAFVLLSNFVPTSADLDELNRVSYLSKRETDNVGRLLEVLEDALRNRSDETVEKVSKNNPLSRLTKNQLEILRLVASGATNNEIAQVRRSSTRAVEKSIERLYATLNIHRDGKSSPRLAAARIYAEIAGTPHGGQKL